MKTILVPTDFSNPAKNAADYAVHLAEKMNMKIMLVHAWHVPRLKTAAMPEAIDESRLQEEMEDALNEEMKRLRRKSTIPVNSRLIAGLAIDAIKALESEASMVVMGMKGADSTLEKLMGSITTRVIRNSLVPVIAVPAQSKYNDPEEIVLAFDYDPKTASSAADGLKDLMKAWSPKIHILNVRSKEERFSLEEVNPLDLPERPEVQQVYYFPEIESVADAILEYAESSHADMIALIPHHYNLLENMFHSSTTRAVARQTHIPLLALPDPHKSIPAYFI